MTGRSVEAYGGKHQASRSERRTARRHESGTSTAHIAPSPYGTETMAASKQDGQQGGYRMSRLSASYHPVSNTRRHGDGDDDEITQEAKQAIANRRRTRPQDDEKKRTSDERESGMGNDDKQANQSVARTRKSTLAYTSPDPEGGGLNQASKLGRAGERGQGERKRITRKHGDMNISSSHRLPSSYQASIAPRTSRRPTSKEPARRHPVAIPSRGKQPSPSYHIGTVPVPVVILFEAVEQKGRPRHDD